MSVLSNLEEFSTSSPYQTWKDLFPQEFTSLKKGYYPQGLSYNTLILSSKTKLSEIFNFLKKKHLQEEESQQVMSVETQTIKNTEHYTKTYKSLTRFKQNAVPTSVTLKSLKEPHLTILKLKWRPCTTSSNKHIQILDLPDNPIVQDILHLLLLPPENTIALQDQFNSIEALTLACTAQHNLKNFREKVPFFKSLSTIIKQVGYPLPFDEQKTVDFFFKNQDIYTSVHNIETDKHKAIFNRVHNLEKIWQISTHFLLTKICPIPCALAFCTQIGPQELKYHLLKYIGNIVNSKNLNTTFLSLVNTPWNFEKCQLNTSLLDLYVHTLKTQNEIFSDSDYLHERIALLSLHQLLKKEHKIRTQNIFDKQMLSTDRHMFRKAKNFQIFCKKDCKSIINGDTELILFSFALTETKLVLKKLKVNPFFFSTAEKTKLIHLLYSLYKDPIMSSLELSKPYDTKLHSKKLIEFEE